MVNSAPVAFHEGNVIFSSFDNHLYAVNCETGKEVWRFRTGKYGNATCPLVYKGVAYYGTRDGIFYAIDAKTGKEIWRFKADKEGSIDKLPLVHEGRVYFGSEDGNLHVLDIETGKELWRFKTGGLIAASPVLWKEYVFFGSWDCNVYKVNIQTHEEEWRFQTSNKTQAYLPHAFEDFRIEVKKSFAFDEARELEKYAKRKGETISLSDYHVSSEYATTSEYKQKSDYDTSLSMFETNLSLSDQLTFMSLNSGLTTTTTTFR